MAASRHGARSLAAQASRDALDWTGLDGTLLNPIHARSGPQPPHSHRPSPSPSPHTPRQDHRITPAGRPRAPPPAAGLGSSTSTPNPQLLYLDLVSGAAGATDSLRLLRSSHLPAARIPSSQLLLLLLYSDPREVVIASKWRREAEGRQRGSRTRTPPADWRTTSMAIARPPRRKRRPWFVGAAMACRAAQSTP